MATAIGTVVAFFIVPMRSLGADAWKIATALMGSYIGGCKLCETTIRNLFSFIFYFLNFRFVPFVWGSLTCKLRDFLQFCLI